VVGLITDNDETACMEEARDHGHVVPGQQPLSLTVIKTKDMIVDYRKKRTDHAPFSSTGLQWSRLRA
jgi:hypothetical protein